MGALSRQYCTSAQDGKTDDTFTLTPPMPPFTSSHCSTFMARPSGVPSTSAQDGKAFDTFTSAAPHFIPNQQGTKNPGNKAQS